MPTWAAIAAAVRWLAPVSMATSTPMALRRDTAAAASGLRVSATASTADRRTVRRYVEAAVAAGLDRKRGVDRLTDELVGMVVGYGATAWTRRHGESSDVVAARRTKIEVWLDDYVPVVKIGELLTREGVTVAERTSAT